MESVANVEVEDLRQSREYKRYMEKVGWKVEGRVFIRKLGPVSIAKIQRTNFPKGWDRILKKNHVFMCKFEPNNTSPWPPPNLGGGIKGGGIFPGFRQDNWPLLGTKTLRVDLRPSEEEIFKSFKKDARYCIRQATNLKPQISKNNFGKFYGIWRKAAGIKRLWIPGEKEYKSLMECFGKKCFCVTINDIAGALVLTHRGVAYYYYSGALPEGKKLQLPYSVVWELMKIAKRRKCKTWDFEGIYDSRWPNKGWRGFSHFKKSFGGEEIEFPGCFTKWCWPF